jgi:hypothetical protein
MVDYDSTSTDVAETNSTGNSMTGVFQHLTTGTDTYSFTQLIDRGAAGESNLSGNGIKTYNRVVDEDALTGQSTRTTSGTDSYSLNQTGTDAAGVFEVALSGTDTFTETDEVNTETGTFERTNDVDGTATGTRTRNGNAESITQAVDQVVTHTGNYIDGDIDISFAGEGRYDALVDDTDTSNAATSTPGMLDHSPTGAPMFMGAPPALPTGGGVESLSSIGASPLVSFAAAGTGTLTGAAFRGVQAAAIPGIALGGQWSGSALQHQFAVLGSDMIEEYCFPAGTEILMADGSAKPIES